MRSSSSVLASSDGGDEGSKDLFSCFYWWRSLPEMEVGATRVRVVKELERLALLSNEALDDLRHRLMAYKAGDLWFPAGGFAKQDMDIPPVVTILLLGFGGAGKSSLVNLMYSVLGRAGFVPFAQTSSPAGRDGRTQYLEEHNVLRSMRNGFCVFDSRGLDYERVAEGLREVSEWMEDGVRHRQPCHGSGIVEAASNGPLGAAAKRFVRRRVNCAMVVVNASEVYQSMMTGDLRPLQAARELFQAPSVKSCCNENPILVLTHGDELMSEERIEARLRICEYLNVSETTGVYDIVCINTHSEMMDEMDPVTSYALSEAVYRAVLVADRGHRPKPSIKDWLMIALSWALYALSVLFTFLACFCSKLAKTNRDHRLRFQ